MSASSAPLGELSGNNAHSAASQGEQPKKRKLSSDAPPDDVLGHTAPDLEVEGASAARGSKRQRKETQGKGNSRCEWVPLASVCGDSIVSRKLTECGVRCTKDGVLACAEAYAVPHKFEDALREPGSTEQFLDHLEEAFDNKTHL